MVQEVIDEHVRSKPYGGAIRDLMLAHFREDWERVVNGRFELTMNEFLTHRRALPRESLGGDYVKSYGEKVIANALFEHGIDYKYESNFRWDGVNYRPDFKIPIGPKGGVIVEYFGLKGEADYDQMSQEKREFVRLLLYVLGKAGVSYRRRSEEEIWRLVRRRALGGFKKAMKTFVGRCRKRDLTPDALESMIASHAPCSTAEALFIVSASRSTEVTCGVSPRTGRRTSTV